jgi:hypothetical protein
MKALERPIVLAAEARQVTEPGSKKSIAEKAQERQFIGCCGRIAVDQLAFCFCTDVFLLAAHGDDLCRESTGLVLEQLPVALALL